MAYLDYNATAPLFPEVRARMQELLGAPANPSSVHGFGREARKHLEAARQTVAGAISAWPNEIIFTATGTEANVMALTGFPGRRLLVSAVEHSSVLRQVPLPNPPPDRGRKNIIPVTAEGIVDLAALENMLAQGETALVSVMLANNETGILQPIAEISQLCKRHGALMHTDAVQGLGKMPVDFGALGVDMMTISAHKCGGPVGAAALVLRRDLPMAPLIPGSQELGRRAGTENVAAIAGFAAAVEKISTLSYMADIRRWLDDMETEMQAQGGQVIGKSTARLPNTSCVVMPGVGNEVQLMDFDLKGFAVSAGSACSSGRIEPSHVLSAMGISKETAACAIRISAGWQTSQQDIRSFGEAWQKTALRLVKKAG